jgi:DNA-3-methyladenine glycosylase I
VIDYKDIFFKAESSLRDYCSLSEDDFKKNFGYYKTYENQDLKDSQYYERLVEVIFYSGFKAETVDKKMSIIKSYFSDFQTVAEYDESIFFKIMQDERMIRNEKKISACIKNAKIFNEIVEKNGSFKQYIASFKPQDSFENLMLLKEELQYTFSFLGDITSYHFMTDIGLSVLKPDRVITRIFKRIGLIESEEQLLKTVIHGRKFSQETGYPIRYIDIIFVTYGQLGNDEYFGIEDGGICLSKNPKCDICGIRESCSYASIKQDNST